MPASLEMEVGDRSTFECLVNKRRAVQWDWYKDEEKLVLPSHRYKVKTFFQFKIKKVRLDDTGVYTCSVRNENGVSNKTFTLTVRDSVKGMHKI